MPQWTQAILIAVTTGVVVSLVTHWLTTRRDSWGHKAALKRELRQVYARWIQAIYRLDFEVRRVWEETHTNIQMTKRQTLEHERLVRTLDEPKLVEGACRQELMLLDDNPGIFKKIRTVVDALPELSKDYMKVRLKEGLKAARFQTPLAELVRHLRETKHLLP